MIIRYLIQFITFARPRIIILIIVVIKFFCGLNRVFKITAMYIILQKLSFKLKIKKKELEVVFLWHRWASLTSIYILSLEKSINDLWLGSRCAEKAFMLIPSLLFLNFPPYWQNDNSKLCCQLFCNCINNYRCAQYLSAECYWAVWPQLYR